MSSVSTSMFIDSCSQRGGRYCWHTKVRMIAPIVLRSTHFPSSYIVIQNMNQIDNVRIHGMK